ncbi:NADH-quinone oxidoreductase subunit J [Acidithiobacillus sp. IBUN Pt1247-S3]|uniref:NADH-quinone oxidoreductase subunit J n=1 Tax=Acidithiobacillus sp. IBUN Pt1247-S3 TaxID=3166642 RepID=UPI0034E38CDA
MIFLGFLLLAVLAVLLLSVLLVHDAMHGVIAVAAILGVLAIVFYLLGAPFLAAMEILLYLGAILVLFLFTLMLLGPEARAAAARQSWRSGWLLGALLLLVFALVLAALVWQQQPITAVVHSLGPVLLGRALFGPNLWWSEAVAVLLFVVIGAVLVLHAGEKDDD